MLAETSTVPGNQHQVAALFQSCCDGRRNQTKVHQKQASTVRLFAGCFSCPQTSFLLAEIDACFQRPPGPPALFFYITFLSRERFVRFVPCHIVSRHGFCAAVRLSQFYAHAVHTVSLCFRFCCATFARNEVEHDGVCYAFICRTRSPLCNLADRGIVSAVNISVVVVPEGWRSHLGPANQLEFDFVSTIPSLLFFKPRERYLYTQ